MFLVDGKYKCLNPLDVADALVKEGMDEGFVSNAFKANTFSTGINAEVGTGYFLITYTDYQALIAEHDEYQPTISLEIRSLNYDSEDDTTYSTWEKLTLTSAVNILGAYESEGSIILIKLEDYRHWMKKIVCPETCNYNVFALEADFNTNYLVDNTTSSSSALYTAEEILDDLMTKFRSEGGTNFSAATTSYDGSFDYEISNLVLSGISIFDAVKTICQTCRITLQVKEDGSFFFTDIAGGTWPSGYDDHLIMNTQDLCPPSRPSTIRVYSDTETYRYFDSRCTDAHPSSVYDYDSSPPSPNYTGAISITAPYFFDTDRFTYSTSLDTNLEALADVMYLVETLDARETRWRGYHKIHLDDTVPNMTFGFEKCIWIDQGRRVFSIAINSNQHGGWNYYDPPLSLPRNMPKGIWLYRFVMTDSSSGGSAGLYGDIYQMDGTATGLNVQLSDPLGIFASVGVDGAGYVIKHCDSYYIVQAACPE